VAPCRTRSTSTLNVAGKSTLANASATALTVSGNTILSGTLGVTGQTTLGNASTTVAGTMVSSFIFMARIKSS
jgi:hypothetical protein